jgi:tubulin-folding cofactor B
MSAMEDHLLVKAWVTGNDHLQYDQLAEGVVAILMTHSNLSANHLDIRLDLHMTIADVKEKFRKHIGTHVDHQRLILKNDGNNICEMSDNRKMLGFYSVKSGMEINIIDTDPFSLSRGGGLTDTSLVQKYRMDDATYDKKSGTMRDYIRKKRADDPNFKLKPMSTPASAAAAAGAPHSMVAGFDKQPAPGAESVVHITVGGRCEVEPGARRGVIKFVGEINQIAAGGHWVGIQFDEPVGSNDGCAKGVKIFECPTGFGSFVRGKNVKCGEQYPERDLFADEDEEDDADAQPATTAAADEEDEI